MTVFELPSYQAARDKINGNPVISWMAGRGDQRPPGAPRRGLANPGALAVTAPTDELAPSEDPVSPDRRVVPGVAHDAYGWTVEPIDEGQAQIASRGLC